LAATTSAALSIDASSGSARQYALSLSERGRISLLLTHCQSSSPRCSWTQLRPGTSHRFRQRGFQEKCENYTAVCSTVATRMAAPSQIACMFTDSCSSINYTMSILLLALWKTVLKNAQNFWEYSTEIAENPGL